MNEKLTKYLFTAYEEIAATPQHEDLTVGLAYAEEKLGQSLTEEEKDAIHAFLRHNEQKLAGVYREGYEAFAAKVAALGNCETEQAQKDEEVE